jgi:pimeloyl-ACP methyl ester carboxylesterase
MAEGIVDGQVRNVRRVSFALADGEMAGWHFVSPGKPRLVFVHANGFCASAYRQVLEPLSADFDILAPDLRGHGRSTLPADPARHRSWDVYARDLLALIDQLDEKPVALAGHSMGAVSSLLAAARLAEVPKLALVEPVVLPVSVYLMSSGPFGGLMKDRLPISRQARRRRNGWPDAAAALSRYANHPTFKRWAEGTLADYLEDGLAETPDGGVKLACDPFWEAANYEAQGHDLGRAARKAAPQAYVLKAQHGSTVVRPGALTRRGAKLTRMDRVGHLAPMEKPGAVTAWLRDVLKAAD